MMGLLTLYSGLLLPWLGGAFWLAFADARFDTDRPANRFRQVGYGFFLGYAFLFIAIITSHQLSGVVSWTGIMAVLLVITVSGAMAAWKSKMRVITTPPQSRTSPGTAMKVLLSIMLMLTTIHIVFVSVEVFTLPVYPWDAWLAWVYRAKAWFMAGNMTQMVGAPDWVTATSADTYTMGAWRYPLFASVVPYWAALSLGSWSETLVNIPVLFAGLAIGMALYGQCREYGLSVPLSLIVCYLLFSIPLFGTHLALAGYADIWMAGFTGLGFVALMRGLVSRGASEKSALQFVIGFLMILFGAWVKNEGAVWLMAALLMILLSVSRLWVPILMILTGLAAYWLILAFGFSYIEIPFVGAIGFVEDRFVIPYIGDFVLETHDVTRAYLDNFINKGSWNLLWLLVAASLFLGLKSPVTSSAKLVRRTALSFILVFLAIQLFIFALTDQGVWAGAYTAINRLPLHFLPTLLFAVALITHINLPGPDATETPGRTITPRRLTISISALLGAIVVMAGTTMYLSKDLPDQPAKTLHYPASEFKFAFGSGLPSGKNMLVTEFANGYALLTSGPVSIQADTLRLLNYTWLPSDPPQEAAFFWRRSDDAGNVLRTNMTTPGTGTIDLAAEPGWRGEISEFGFLIAGTNYKVVEIGETALIPDSLTVRLGLTWQSWITFEEWSQQSINFLYGGDTEQIIALPILLTAWLLTTLFLVGLILFQGNQFEPRSFLLTTGILFLVAWLLIDIRWSVNNLRQMQLSLQTHLHMEGQQSSSIELDRALYQYIQRVKQEVLGAEPGRILIIGDENTPDYYPLKAKYHLLPHSVFVDDRFRKKLAPGSVDFVIVFGPEPDFNKIHGEKRSWLKSLVQVDRGEWGVVYRVK